MLERQQLIRLLLEVPAFRALGTDELSDVAASAQVREAQRHDYIFRQGVAADAVYVLTRGRVKVTQSAAQGSRVLLRFLGPGDMFGSLLLNSEECYPSSAQAVRWAQVLTWTAGAMSLLVDRHPRIALNVLRELNRGMRELSERYVELATERVERRVAHALMRLARQAGWKTDDGVLLIDMPLSRQDLAEMTGTTLYTVSRILRDWGRQGLVDTGRERITIVQPGEVCSVAEGRRYQVAPDSPHR